MIETIGVQNPTNAGKTAFVPQCQRKVWVHPHECGGSLSEHPVESA